MELYQEMENASSGKTSKMFAELKDMEKDHMATAKKRYDEIREHIVGFRAF